MFALATLLPRRVQRAATPANTALDLPALVGAAGWSRLPLAVQHRFSVTHDDVTYAGHMDLRCSPIGHIYVALARMLGGPLTHLNTNSVPTTVRVCDNGHGGVVGERSFHAERRDQARVVRSTTEIGADGTLLERTDGGLSMSLDVFEENGALVFRSRRFWLVLSMGQLGHVRLPVPTLLTPGTCRVEHANLGDGLFRFTLSMKHPLWGETFFQTGVFADPAPSLNTTPITTESAL